jgi:hypothetical protein
VPDVPGGQTAQMHFRSSLAPAAGIRSGHHEKI